MEAFEAYGMFLALRSHFTSGYDYVKYNGKIRTNYDAFLKRNDRFFFHRLGKKDSPQDYVVANLIHDEKMWITDMMDSECEDRYVEWKKRRDSLGYVFERDLEKLEEDFNDNFRVVDGQYPPLLEKFLEDDISPETMVILNEMTSAFKVWNKKITDEFVWPSIYNRLKKYRSFLKIEDRMEKFKKQVIDKSSRTV